VQPTPGHRALSGLHRNTLWLLLACLFSLPATAQADISLPGAIHLGDNDSTTYTPRDPITYQQIRDYPIHFQLTEEVTITEVRLWNIQNLESNGHIRVFIDNSDRGRGADGSATVDITDMTLTAGLHTIAFEGQCYKKNGDPLNNCTGNSDEDDFDFDAILLKTSTATATTAAIHFVQRRHPGDYNDDNDNYDPTDVYPFYPDAPEGSTLSLPVSLTATTTGIQFDFYRLRNLNRDCQISWDGNVIGTLTPGGDPVDLADDPYSLSHTFSQPQAIGAHTLTLTIGNIGYRNNDDFSWDELIIRPAVTTTLHHIRIEHDGSASACAPEDITIKACADATCAPPLYPDSVTVNLNDIGTWSTDPVTFSGGEIPLKLAASGVVTLGGTATSPTASNATTCYNTTTGTNDCTLNFASANFAFDVPDHTSATRQLVTITACASHFANKTRAIKFWSTYIDPNSGTKQGSIVAGTGNADCTTGYSSLGTSEAGATTLNLDFSSGSSPQATFSLCYPDAGKVQLNARYDGASTNAPPDAGVVVLGNDTFVAKPSGFVLSDIKQTATPQLLNPAATDASGAKFVKAGETFTATVTAKNAKNETTPNFSREATPEGVKLTANLFTPTGGTNPALTCKGSATDCVIPGGVVNFTNGSATVTDLVWSEVGIITLTPSIGDGNYLGAGEVTGTTSGNVGRFIPDHFAITPGSVTEGCDPGNFTYFGQDGFSTGFTLIAQNTANATTQNYTGNFAKFDPTAWNNYNFTATGLPAAPSPASTLLASATAPTGAWSNGTASVIAKHLASRPAAPVAPATITVSAKPADTDGVTLVSAVAVQTAATPLRYGRIVLQNAYGPETATLKMRLLTQYYDGAAFIANPDDITCSKYSATDLTCSNLIGPVTCTDVIASGVDISNGQYFILSAPMKTGTLLYTLTVDPWLQYEWDNVTPQDYNENPTGRANFGIYRGNDRIINWREVIR